MKKVVSVLLKAIKEKRKPNITTYFTPRRVVWAMFFEQGKQKM